MLENVETLPRALADEQPSAPVEPIHQDVVTSAQPTFLLNRLFYHSNAPNAPLRIGVMIDGMKAQFFMRKIVEDIHACNFAKVVAVIQNVTPGTMPSAPRASLPTRIIRSFVDPKRRRGLLRLAYIRWIDRRNPSPDPCAAVDCTDLFRDVQLIPVTPVRKGFVDRFPTESVEQLKSLDLDVVLRFGFRIIRGEALNVARYGVWSFHHDDSERYRGGPAATWEVMERNPLSGAVLQCLDESLDAGPVLCRTLVATTPRPSVSMNRFNVYWSTQHFVIQKLYELHQYGIEHVTRRAVKPAMYHGKRPIYRRPTNIEMAQWLVPTLARGALRKLSSNKNKMHWRVGLRKSATPLFKEPTNAALREFSWLSAPRGHFWADPFLIEERGDTWMFFEDYTYAAQRGVISCGRIEGGQLHDVRTALDRPFHVSFPYLFRHDGSVWMIPESSQAGQVQLYRARRFPDDWVLERTLLDLPGVDSTIFQYQDRWWMFVTPLIVTGCAATTLLFVAPQPQGPWSLHPAGSVCSDVRWARCAGQIIRDGDRILRPSQDCSIGYGHSIAFNEIKVLNDTTYEETRGPQLLPDPSCAVLGVHTYNRAGEWEVLDKRALEPRTRIL